MCCKVIWKSSKSSDDITGNGLESVAYSRFFVQTKNVWLWKGGICLDYEKEKIESIRRRYPASTQICLDEMEGEPQMPAGLKGEVFCVDDIGQIHVQWENGSTLALNVGVDQFHKTAVPEKRREKGEPSR